MKKMFILIFVISFALNAFSQTNKKLNLKSCLVNKEWYVKFDSYERTGVGDTYKKDKQNNLFILKANNQYLLKLDGVERSGAYLIESDFLFLFVDGDYELAYEKSLCVAFRIKLINPEGFAITTVAYASEGTIMTFAKY